MKFVKNILLIMVMQTVGVKIIVINFGIASKLHERDKQEHPELHKGPYCKKNGRCDETTYCSCGFKWSADSSD
jgi:hypothetical protein